MDTQRILLTLVGAIASLILAMILIWYSKKTIAKTMSRRHILHMLKTKGMTGIELKDATMECRSAIISPKLVPVMLVKLQEEGLIQQAANSMYVITTKGLESLKSLDSMNKEFQKIAEIMQKTSMISKFMVNEAFDWIAGVKDDIAQKYTDSSQEEVKTGVPLYGADKNQAKSTKSTYNFEGGSEF